MNFMTKYILLLMTIQIRRISTMLLQSNLLPVMRDGSIEMCMTAVASNSRVVVPNVSSKGHCAFICLNDARPCLIFSYEPVSRTCVLSNDIYEVLTPTNSGCKIVMINYNRPKGCNDIKMKGVSSGLYEITVGFTNMKVWCDMTTNGGGYTIILNDGNFGKLTQRAVDLLFANRTHVLLFLNINTGTQSYAIISQLDQFSNILFACYLRTPTNAIPATECSSINDPHIGPPYLHCTVMSQAQGASMVEHGIKVNGVKAAKIPLDSGGCEYFSFYPKSTGCSSHFYTSVWPYTSVIITKFKPAANNTLPPIAFFFFELSFSGAMTYMQTDGRQDAMGVTGVAIGFK